MPDFFHRCEIPGLKLRAYTAVSLDTVRAITGAHNTTPNATAALGRTVNAGILLSSMLKFESNETLSLKIQGSGPLKEIQVQADARGNVRGYTSRPRIDEETDLGAIDTPKALGAGLFTVSRDLGLKEPYVGTVHLVRGDIATDAAYYLTSSEQIPSAVIIALTLDNDGTVKTSGGILIQTSPETPEKAITLIEQKLADPQTTLSGELEKGKSPEDFLSEILGGEKIQITNSIGIQNRCRCSKELIMSMLSSFSKDDMDTIIIKDKGAAVNCTFCNAEYSFSEEELHNLVKKTVN